MKFISTRKNKKKINFKEVTLKGLAEDGGLYVPYNWNNLNSISLLPHNSFQDIAFYPWV